jgi:hypothetical protein
MSNAALKTIPEIITAASRTTLGILALLIVVVGIIALYFFRNEKAVRYRFFVFLIMFAGTGVFGWSVLIAQREDALRAQTQILPDLKLNLAFSGSEAANPYHSKVSVFVQPNNQLDDEYDSPQYLRADIRPLPGPGGLVIEFRKLAVGDRIYVEVEDHGKRWRSYPMTMLEANLQLNPAEQ